MSIYEFKNRDKKSTYLEFSEESMKIKENTIKEQTIEYIFSYSDIDKYEIIPEHMGGVSVIAKITFYSKNNKIIKIENSNKTYESMITVKAGSYIIPEMYCMCQVEDKEDIRKVIYENSPLRCDLDMQFEAINNMDKKYEELTEENTGWIYLEIKKDLTKQYNISINNLSYIVIYSDEIKEKLQNQKIYRESKSEPYWLDKKTLAFKIPFGEWDISYCFNYNVYSGYRNERTAYAKSVHVNINKEHPIAKIKSKMSFWGYKLIEEK